MLPVVELDGGSALLVSGSCQTLVPAAVQSALVQDLVEGRRLALHVQVQPAHLLGRPAQTLSHVRHPALSDHHALRPSEAPEGGVGRQVGAAHEAAAAHVGHAVRVLHVKQSALHDLDEHTQEMTSAYRQRTL